MGIENSFQALSTWAHGDGAFPLQPFENDKQKSYEVIQHEQRKGLITTVIEYFKGFFHRKTYQGEYKYLSEFFDQVFGDSKITKEGDFHENITSIATRLKDEFLKAHTQSGIDNQLKALDLLEGYNELVKKMKACGEHSIKRITSKELANVANTIESAVARAKAANAMTGQKSILLMAYQDLEVIVHELQDKKRALTKDEIRKLFIEKKLSHEIVPGGWMIDLLYRHQFVGQVTVTKLCTLVAAKLYGSSKPLRSVEETLAYFRNLHIDLYMDINGKMWSFSELFGFDIRELKSHPELFTRSLTESAKKVILKDFHESQKKIRAELRDQNAQVICSNAYSRLSIHTLQPKDVDTKFRIRQKILSQSKENVQEAKDMSGASGKYDFSVKDLLGGFSHDVDVRSKDDAQKALLSCMTDMLNHHEAHMVIQRLSPSDIHHYYSTADCTVLSFEECCKELKSEIGERERLGEVVDQTYRDALEKIQEFLKVAPGEIPSEKSTINIIGEQEASVSPLALRSRSDILAQNDRKIMMVKHNDGSLAIHAFIGATAVNLIDVTKKTGEAQAGCDMGSMSYGSEKDKSEWLLQRAVSSVRRWIDSIIQRFMPTKELQTLNRIQIEDKDVGFGPRGSTVISFYLGRDYALTDTVEKASSITRTLEGGEEEKLEIKARLGNVVAVPVLKKTLDAIKNLDPEILTRRPFEDRLKRFFNALQGLKERSSIEEKWFEILKKWKDNVPLQGDNLYLFQKLESHFKDVLPTIEFLAT